MGRLARPAKPPSSGAVLFYIPHNKGKEDSDRDENARTTVGLDRFSIITTIPVSPDLTSTPRSSSSSSATLVSPTISSKVSDESSLSSLSDSEYRQNRMGSGTVLSNAGNLIGLIKDVSEAFDSIPYVKVVAGAVYLILEITDKVQNNQQRGMELIDKVKIYARDVFESLLMLKGQRDEILEKLKEDLLDIANVLENIHSIINQLAKVNPVTRVLQRNDILARIEEQDRRLDTCITSFQIRSLSALRTRQAIDLEKPVEARQTPGYSSQFKNTLRSKPQIVFGREKEIEEIVNTVVNKVPSRIAILGSGGIGKTTLALSVLHDDRIYAKYGDKCLFLSCEAITCAEQLITELAFALDIQKDDATRGLVTSILRRFEESPTMIVFDNFETAWDPAESRNGIETFLQDITAIKTCTVIVTMRGSQRPSGVEWTNALPPLLPIDLDSATATFRAIANKMDEFAGKLLRAVDCVPLAVTILANLAAVDGETTEALWERWNEENTSMIGDGHDRLTSLETSVKLSIFSPRMRRNPDALSILSALALLPDGMSPEALRACSSDFPSSINVRRALSTLRQNALIYEDSNRFLLILSPIRFFIRSYHPPDVVLRAVVQNYFLGLASRGANYHDLDTQKCLQTENGNIEAVLADLLRSGTPVKDLVEPVFNFCQFMYCFGIASTQVIGLLSQRLEAEPLPPVDRTQKGSKTHKIAHFRFIQRWKNNASHANEKETAKVINTSLKLRGDCFGCWGQLLSRQSKFELAKQKFERAINLHEVAGDVDGKAYDLHNLAYLLVRDVTTLDQASARFQEAYKLHQNIGDRTGQAHNLMGCGHVSLQCSRLEDAIRYFQESLDIFTSVSDDAGQAAALNNLGSALAAHSKFKDSEDMYRRAFDLSSKTGDLVAKSQSLIGLSSSYLLRSQFLEAREYVQEAVDIRSPSIDPDHLHLLGRVNIAEYHLMDAEKCLEESRRLHKDLLDKSGEADDCHYLAHLRFLQGAIHSALEHARTAKALYRGTGNILGEADATAWEGITIALCESGDPGDGIALLEKALALHSEVNCILGQAFDMHNIGWQCLRQFPPKVDKAMEMFEKALELHGTVGNVQGVADDHNKIAECLVRQQQFPEALLRISEALSLHTRIGDLGGQADDLYIQGTIFLHQCRLDEAEKVLRLALDTHRQLGLRFGEVRDIATLGSVLFEKAKSGFIKIEEPKESDLSAFEPAKEMMKNAEEIFENEIRAPNERYQCAQLYYAWLNNTWRTDRVTEGPTFGYESD